MDPEKLKKSIAIATEAVEHIQDKDIKIKSYEVILNNLLKEQSNKIVIATSPDTNYLDSYSLLANKLGVSKEKPLNDYVELGEEPRLLFNLNRNNAFEQQVIFLLTFLTLRKICYGNSEINSSKLRDILAEHKISSINNLSVYVKKISKFIIHKSGKIGSINTTYKLSEEGLSSGLKLLNEIINGKEVKDIDLNFLNVKVISKNKTNSKVGLEIDVLLEEGFFSKHKKTSEVVTELRKRGFFNRRQDIDAYLRKVLLGRKLLREKVEKKWAYVIKK